MEYLNKDEVFIGAVINYNNENLLLIAPDEENFTFIEESDTSLEIDRNAKLYVKQRWLVEVQPKTRFDKPFRTHRKITSYYCTYKQYLEEEKKSYKHEVIFHKDVDSNILKDSFNGNMY